MAWTCKECGEEVGWICEGRCIYCNTPGTTRPPGWKMPKSRKRAECPYCFGEGHVLDERGDKWLCMACKTAREQETSS